MDVNGMMALLAESCAALEDAGDHAAAAHVGHAMDLVAARHDVAVPSGEPPRGQPDR